MSDDLLLLEKSGHVATLTINRPDQLNPLGKAGDGDAFEAVTAEIAADMDIRCAILTGAGRAFSAGGDVKAMKERTGAFGGNPADIKDGYANNIHKVVRSLWNCPVPMISAVNGPAIGLGCDVACMTDIRIFAESARFGMTFARLGLIPGDGGAWLMPRIVGLSRAAEMVYSCQLYDADTAVEWGLASRKVPDADLMAECIKLAETISGQPPKVLREAKKLLRKGQAATYDQVMDLSASTQALLHMEDDHMEGVDAILEKRKPVFKG